MVCSRRRVAREDACRRPRVMRGKGSGDGRAAALSDVPRSSTRAIDPNRQRSHFTTSHAPGMPRQLTLDAVRYHTGRGGPRHGAGRPRGPRPRVRHRTRPQIVARHPQHVTIRLRRGIPSLRQHCFVRPFRVSLSHACVRHSFRVIHYSIQRDHVHLLIEARSNYAIACGMKSVGARSASSPIVCC
jgi:hypothetical protein